MCGIAGYAGTDEPDILRRMADRGTAWVPTFSPVHFQWRRPELAGWSPPTIAKLRAILDSHAEHVAMAAGLGVNLVAGSDAGSPGVAHGAALIDEIRHFLDCGLAMDQALRDLYKQGLITYEMAQRRSHNPAELEKLIAGE